MTDDLLTRAICFAAQAHGSKTRKGDGVPMVLHAMETAAVVATLTDDPAVLAAAVLHDTVEETRVTADDILQCFGPRVAELVASETEDKYPGVDPALSWKIRKEETLRHLFETRDPGVKMLWLGDKLANLRSFYRLSLKMGPEMWALFHQKDPEMHHWYYRSVAQALKELENTQAWKEYDWLIGQVFSA